MIVTLGCLVVGIVGFVKGRLNVSKTRELRGRGMYAAATLLCLPLPLWLLASVATGLWAAASGRAVNNNQALFVGGLCTYLPILSSLVIGYVTAKPKVSPPVRGQARNFEVGPLDR